MSKSRALVIVESPTKAKTIRKFLGEEYVVEASMGHIRDLPSNAQEIPLELRKKSWARLGINTEVGFEPIYVVPAEKQRKVAELQEMLKNTDALYLATDEDREGESIGWHLAEVLKPKVPTYRMVFHEITKTAIEKALSQPRQLDLGLVQAQEARRVTDRLVGYVVSPLLWKKVSKNLSAGRVQSAAVKLLVNRERERMLFKKAQWWDMSASFMADQKSFTASLYEINHQALADSQDFDSHTGLLKSNQKKAMTEVEGKALEKKILAKLDQCTSWISKIDRKSSKKTPLPPFTTSTLQQESNRKLGLSTSQTMRVAQSLYENGFITYMRTDSVSLSAEALQGTRNAIKQRFGADQLSVAPRQYQTSTKGAQEAHEAIRPAGEQMLSASQLGLTGAEHELYQLIWQRTIATQMQDAEISTTQVSIVLKLDEDELLFKASGREIIKQGFLEVYQIEENEEAKLPYLSLETPLQLQGLKALAHETRPAVRFNEATLVKELEKEGIGRPSTYATIIDTIQKRGYVKLNARQLIPTFIGIAVTQVLENSFSHIVDLAFTASMENWLDEVTSQGEAAKQSYLSQFYEQGLLGGVSKAEALDSKEICSIQSPRIRRFKLRVGKFGPFAEYVNEQGEIATFSVPQDAVPDEVDDDYLQERLQKSLEGDLPLGMESEESNARAIYLKVGRYGAYVQLGESQDPNNKKASIPKNIPTDSLQVEQALYLLSLPKRLGIHPVHQQEIVLKQGPYGPYLSYNGLSIPLGKEDDLFSIDFERALELIEEKLSKSAIPSGAIELGKSESFGDISIKSGKFGPYLKAGKDNISLSKSINVNELTLDKAIEIIKEKLKNANAKTPSKTKGGAVKKGSTTADVTAKTATEGKAKATTKTKAKATAAAEPTETAVVDSSKAKATTKTKAKATVAAEPTETAVVDSSKAKATTKTKAKATTAIEPVLVVAPTVKKKTATKTTDPSIPLTELTKNTKKKS